MRRIALWFLSTLSVLVLLFGYHTSTAGSLAAGSPTSIVGTAGSGSAVSESSGSAGSAAGSSARSGTGSSSGDSSSSGSSGSSSSGSSSSSTSTVTGAVASTEWGPVQVQLTIEDGTITDVSVPQYPSGNPRDDEINSYALPVLVQETLDQQSAGIDMVSGATVTSTGYVQSLQSALDQAGL